MSQIPQHLIGCGADLDTGDQTSAFTVGFQRGIAWLLISPKIEERSKSLAAQF